jgi:hypothetical protein
MLGIEENPDFTMASARWFGLSCFLFGTLFLPASSTTGHIMVSLH